MSNTDIKQDASGMEGVLQNTGRTLLKKVLLDPDSLCNKESMASYMKQTMELPEWFGGNLDALSDVLSEVTDETVFEVELGARGEFAKDGYPRKVLKVVVRAVKENPHLHLYLTDPDWRPGEAVSFQTEDGWSENPGSNAKQGNESDSDAAWRDECCDWSDES